MLQAIQAMIMCQRTRVNDKCESGPVGLIQPMTSTQQCNCKVLLMIMWLTVRLTDCGPREMDRHCIHGPVVQARASRLTSTVQHCMRQNLAFLFCSLANQLNRDRPKDVCLPSERPMMPGAPEPQRASPDLSVGPAEWTTNQSVELTSINRQLRIGLHAQNLGISFAFPDVAEAMLIRIQTKQSLRLVWLTPRRDVTRDVTQSRDHS